MTEEEAAKKLCHLVIPLRTEDPVANWGWEGQCMRSRCMAWRWTEKHVMQDQSAVPDGYCGLAGRP